MDPSTTLFTFLFETDPAVRSVDIVGSWDNFTNHFAMERDSRRGGGQWRGCHSLRDTVEDTWDDDVNNGLDERRSRGGLKMGHTYYYFYEVDGSVETYNQSLPHTTMCPSLPGQRVNTMSIPTERTLRRRSASLNSMHRYNFQTLDPESKYVAPRAVPPIPPVNCQRLGTAPPPQATYRKHANRSLSPAAWRRFFTRKASLSPSRTDRRTERRPGPDDKAVVNSDHDNASADQANIRPFRGAESRDQSPDSRRQCLVDDETLDPESVLNDRPAVIIPEDILEENEEEEKDDVNFSVSALIGSSQNAVFPTGLSPPPLKKAGSTDYISNVTITGNSSSLTLIPAKPERTPPAPPTATATASNVKGLVTARQESRTRPADIYCPPSTATEEELSFAMHKSSLGSSSYCSSVSTVESSSSSHWSPSSPLSPIEDEPESGFGDHRRLRGQKPILSEQPLSAIGPSKFPASMTQTTTRSSLSPSPPEFYKVSSPGLCLRSRFSVYSSPSTCAFGSPVRELHDLGSVTGPDFETALSGTDDADSTAVENGTGPATHKSLLDLGLSETAFDLGGTFLNTEIDTGLDNFAEELGWMVNTISQKRFSKFGMAPGCP